MKTLPLEVDQLVFLILEGPIIMNFQIELEECGDPLATSYSIILFLEQFTVLILGIGPGSISTWECLIEVLEELVVFKDDPLEGLCIL